MLPTVREKLLYCRDERAEAEWPVEWRNTRSARTAYMTLPRMFSANAAMFVCNHEGARLFRDRKLRIGNIVGCRSMEPGRLGRRYGQRRIVPAPRVPRRPMLCRMRAASGLQTLPFGV